MPIYEYRCCDCGHQFELMQKFSDPPAETCPSCSGTVQKLISRSAFHLKGSGWYVTDYGRNGANGKAASKDGSTESSDTQSSDTQSSDTQSKSTSAESSSTGSSSTESTKSSTASSAA